MSKSQYMKYTTVTPEKSIQTIIKEISTRGATQILYDVNDKGQLVGLSFLLKMPDGQSVPVKLPVRIKRMSEMVFDDLGPRQQESWSKEQVEEKALMIAWRQLCEWIKAQMALIDLDIAKAEEVFMPYMQLKSGKTFFESFENAKYKALTE